MAAAIKSRMSRTRGLPFAWRKDAPGVSPLPKGRQAATMCHARRARGPELGVRLFFFGFAKTKTGSPPARFASASGIRSICVFG